MGTCTFSFVSTATLIAAPARTTSAFPVWSVISRHPTSFLQWIATQEGRHTVRPTEASNPGRAALCFVLQWIATQEGVTLCVQQRLATREGRHSALSYSG